MPDNLSADDLKKLALTIPKPPTAGIATPQMASVRPAVNLPGVTVPSSLPESPMPELPAAALPRIAGPSTSSGMPLPEARSMAGPAIGSPQMQHDVRVQSDLNQGSGVHQLGERHPFIGGLAKVADVLGTVFAPNLARAIPGTTLHHNMLVGNNNNALNNDVAQGKVIAETAKDNAEADKALHPPVQKPDNPEAAAYETLNDPNSTPEDKQRAQAALEQVKGAGKDDKGVTSEFQLWRKDNPNGTAEDYAKFQESHKKDSAHTAEDIRSAIADAYEQGNPKEVARLQAKLKAVGDPYAGTRVQILQQGATDKHDSVLDKKTQPYQAIVSEAEGAHELQKMAESGNAAADVDLALSFFKVMRSGGQGIRFTKQEQELILGARNSAGDLQAAAQKVFGQGQKFTPQQRQQIVDVIDMHAKAANSAMARIKGGGKDADAEAAPSAPAGNAKDPLGLR